MGVIFKELEKDNFLLGLEAEAFSQKAAYYYNRMNDVHPFRSGNGRVIRLFIEDLANNNGLELDWKNLTQSQWLKASEQALKGDRSQLAGCFQAAGVKKVFGQKDDYKPNLHSAQSQSAMEQVIKLATKSMKAGKGTGSSFSEDDHTDFKIDRGTTMDM